METVLVVCLAMAPAVAVVGAEASKCCRFSLSWPSAQWQVLPRTRKTLSRVLQSVPVSARPEVCWLLLPALLLLAPPGRLEPLRPALAQPLPGLALPPLRTLE